MTRPRHMAFALLLVTFMLTIGAYVRLGLAYDCVREKLSRVPIGAGANALVLSLMVPFESLPLLICGAFLAGVIVTYLLLCLMPLQGLSPLSQDTAPSIAPPRGSGLHFSFFG